MNLSMRVCVCNLLFHLCRTVAFQATVICWPVTDSKLISFLTSYFIGNDYDRACQSYVCGEWYTQALGENKALFTSDEENKAIKIKELIYYEINRIKRIKKGVPLCQIYRPTVVYK